MGKSISNNPNTVLSAPGSFSEKSAFQIPLAESDKQIIDDVLKELGEQKTKQEDAGGQKIIETLVEEVKSMEPEASPQAALPAQTGQAGVESEKQDGFEKTTEELSKKEIEKEGVGEEFLERLKRAKSEYEKLGQPLDEKEIVGVQAIETYLNWVKEAREVLKNTETSMMREKVFAFIPKRIYEQLKRNNFQTTSPKERLEEKARAGEEKKLQERVRHIEKRIDGLNQNKPEYPEELLPLETKKFLVEKESENTDDKDSINIDDEKLKQEQSTKDLVEKFSFENTAPVVQPEKEEKMRLEKARLAEGIEKEGTAEKYSSEFKIEPEQKEITVDNKEKEYIYTDTQLLTAAQKREEFYEKLSSVTVSDWYQSPSKNRDFVNKQIIQAAEILSGKKDSQIDMTDIQTARLFMFNNAPKKILKHPAFSYVEGFYNYQSFQGCVGINPEQVIKDKKGVSKTSKVGELKKGSVRNSFIKQVSGE